MLTGVYKSIDDFELNDYRRFNPRFMGENFQKNLEVVEEIKQIAESKKVSPSQLSLAWVLYQGEDFITIPGTKKLKYLEENLGALNVTITAEDDKKIREAISKIGVAGERYDPVTMKSVNA
ncbi:hypothetical protein HK096_004702 [Nowakowskiella sp. JEL0078]|nr:hypothetical protein HK096_004702 [Nowakowskiella sp. JEL0078]